MATKFGISVVISAIDRATAVISKVGKSAKSLSDGIGKVTGPIAKVGAYATAAAGIVGAVAVKIGADLLESAGHIKDFSNQIGWNAESLQAWTYAAGQAGVGGEEFEGSLQKMTKSMADLKARTGPLYTLLKDQGDVKFLKQLKGASGPEALDLLVKKLESLPDAGSRARLAMAAFGKSGSVMARLAAEGSGSLARMREEAVRLGGVMSTDDVNAAEEFGDNIDKLKFAVRGVGNTILSALVPHLDKVVGKLTNWIGKNKAVIAAKVEVVVARIGAALERLGNWLDENGESIWAGIEKGAALIGTLIEAAAKHADLFAAVWVGGKVAGAIANVAGSVESVLKGMKAIGTFLMTPLGGAIGAFLGITLYSKDVGNDELNSDFGKRQQEKNLQDYMKRTGKTREQALAEVAAYEAKVRNPYRDNEAGDQSFMSPAEAGAAQWTEVIRANTAVSGAVDVNVNLNGMPAGSDSSVASRGKGVGKVQKRETRNRAAPAGARFAGAAGGAW